MMLNPNLSPPLESVSKDFTVMPSIPCTIRVQKLNSGIEITVSWTKPGRYGASRLRQAAEAVIRDVSATYRECVRLHANSEVWSSYYLQEELQSAKLLFSNLDQPTYNRRGFIPLEPWGFAVCTSSGQPAMLDTGSAPTRGRALVLLAYQAPLDVYPQSNGYVHYFVEFSWELIL